MAKDTTGMTLTKSNLQEKWPSFFRKSVAKEKTRKMEEELIARGDLKNILTNCNIFSQTTNLKHFCNIYATTENMKNDW